MPPPIVSSTLLATALAAASNIVAQQLEQRRKGFTSFTLSFPDLICFVVLNLITAPLNFYWQHFLEHQFPSRQKATYTALPRLEEEDPHQLEVQEPDAVENGQKPGLSYKNTAIKWFVDCMTMGALLNTTSFLIIMGLLKGRNVEEIGDALRRETLVIIWASYKIWPLASIVNFAFIPVDWRVVFLSAVGLIWGVYMSLMAARQ